MKRVQLVDACDTEWRLLAITALGIYALCNSLMPVILNGGWRLRAIASKAACATRGCLGYGMAGKERSRPARMAEVQLVDACDTEWRLIQAAAQLPRNVQLVDACDTEWRMEAIPEGAEGISATRGCLGYGMAEEHAGLVAPGFHVQLVDACDTEWRNNLLRMTRGDVQCNSLMPVILNGGSTASRAASAALCNSLMPVILNGGKRGEQALV